MVHRHWPRAVVQVGDVAHALYGGEVAVAVHLVAEVPDPNGGVVAVALHQLCQVTLRLDCCLRVVHAVCAAEHRRRERTVPAGEGDAGPQETHMGCRARHLPAKSAQCQLGCQNSGMRARMAARLDRWWARTRADAHRNGSHLGSKPRHDRQRRAAPAPAGCAPSSSCSRPLPAALARERAAHGHVRHCPPRRMRSDRSSRASSPPSRSASSRCWRRGGCREPQSSD